MDVVGKGSRSFLAMAHPAVLAIDEDFSRAADFLALAVLQAITAPEKPPMQDAEQPDFSHYAGPIPVTVRPLQAAGPGHLENQDTRYARPSHGSIFLAVWA